ncbi:unnamed protein product [Cunninghamella echinulata]
METFIQEPNLNVLGDNNETLFSLSQFDLELQQQAQAALQQQRLQQQSNHISNYQQQQQRPSNQNNIWQDFDRFLPIDCQPFMMNNNNTNNTNTTTNNNTYNTAFLNTNESIQLSSQTNIYNQYLLILIL